ncbi:MAG: hypothetical protein K0S41_2067 [Anaerocolumna sp.]|jgi:hypothetical protein|nr:hypothetical protein [Anaerocolumna sp.]
MKKITYSCPAVPPEGIFVGKIYETGKDEKGFYYTDGKIKVHEEEAFINMLFSPIEAEKVIIKK